MDARQDGSERQINGWVGAALVAAIASAVIYVCANAGVSAQELQNRNIDIAYVKPRNPAFLTYYEDLTRRKALEELRQFLSPIKLPRKILVVTDECGGDSIRYKSDSPIFICYEHLDKIVKLAPQVGEAGPVLRETLITGAFVEYILHSVTFALFDVLEIPIWGRKHDAADYLTAYILMQFGKDIAVRTVTGAVWYFKASHKRLTTQDFARETSPEVQRLYNFLCIAYGADPETFGPIVSDTLLLTPRAGRCRQEYSRVDYSFRESFMAHLDPALIQRVRSMEWLKPSS
jgi:hypothetical protein